MSANNAGPGTPQNGTFGAYSACSTKLRLDQGHTTIGNIDQLRRELLELYRHKIITVMRRMYDQEKRLIRFAGIKHLMTHARRHGAKRTWLQFKHAMTMLTFVPDFKYALHTHKKIVDTRMQMARHA